MATLRAEHHAALALIATNWRANIAASSYETPLERGFFMLQVQPGVEYLAACCDAGFVCLEELEIGAAMPMPDALAFVWRRILTRNAAQWPVFAEPDSSDFAE